MTMETETEIGFNRKITTSQCSAMLGNIGDAMYVIGGKWKLRIIVALHEGHSRFNELQRAIPGISAKVLSNELKELELSGFVHRHVDTGTPIVVTYHATDYTHTLQKVLEALAEWGGLHREKLRSEAR